MTRRPRRKTSTKTVKKALIDKDLTTTGIGESLGISKQMVSAVVNGRHRTPWVRREIAKLVDIPYSKLWGAEDPGTDHERRGASKVDTSTNTTPALNDGARS